MGIPRVRQGEESQDPPSTQCAPDTLTRALWDPPAGEEVDLAVVSGHTKAQVQPDCSLGLPRQNSASPCDPRGTAIYTKPCLALEAKVKVIYTLGTSEGTEQRWELAGQKS